MRWSGLGFCDWGWGVTWWSVGHGFGFRSSFFNFCTLFWIFYFFKFSIKNFRLDLDFSDEFIFKNKRVLIKVVTPNDKNECLPMKYFHRP